MSWTTVAVIAQAIGLPALILFYVKDRRKNVADTKVAEGTVQDRIDVSSTTAVEGQIGLIQKAFQAERDSLARHIDDLEERLDASERRSTEAEAREAAKTAEIATMRTELERLRAQVDTLSDELQAASLRIQSLLSDAGS